MEGFVNNKLVVIYMIFKGVFQIWVSSFEVELGIEYSSFDL